ncbi:MAG: hypothetical protein ACR2QK_22360, partial [Acidimicrobiales bacterium]
VSKTDLLTTDGHDELTTWLGESSSAAIVVGHPGHLGPILAPAPDAGSDLGPGHGGNGDPHPDRDERPASAATGLAASEVFEVSTRAFSDEVDLAEVEAWLGSIDGLVRAKGIVDTAAGARLTQWSAGRIEYRPWNRPQPARAIVTITASSPDNTEHRIHNELMIGDTVKRDTR